MSDAAITIREMTPDDWPAVRSIYEEGIATGDATFETEAPAWERWDAARIRACRLVAEIDGSVVAWAALSPYSSRLVYAGVAEDTIYVGAAARGRRVGRKLLRELVDEAERKGFWTLLAGIFAENVASIALHEGCGFRLVGHLERLAHRDGRWRDVLLFERRSANVGR